ncbi:MAG: hypothetical protein P8L23_02335 [Flavobacteriales bacterium]|nr:hypothetical protein [Flavobacteriales bacterium]
MKKLLSILSIAFINLNMINYSFSQSNVIDCNNVTYNKDTFYVSMNDNIMENTIYYNDSNSIIYPSHCLVLDDSLLISVSYVSGPINTNSNCHIFTHLTQNSSRDTLDFDFEISFNTSNFPNNTIVNGSLVLSDANSTCTNPVTIILQNDMLNSTGITIHSNKKLIKTIDFLGRETIPKPNVPYIEIYDDGSFEKKIVN